VGWCSDTREASHLGISYFCHDDAFAMPLGLAHSHPPLHISQLCLLDNRWFARLDYPGLASGQRLPTVSFWARGRDSSPG